MAVPDFFSMAEAGLQDAVLGEWEISHDERTVWGRAVVKGLKHGVILADTVIPCSFSFRKADTDDVTTAAVTIVWGKEASYAKLECCRKDYLRWRLPTQEDGEPGEYTVWRRTKSQASKDQASGEVGEVRAKAASEVAAVHSETAEKIEALRRESEEQLAEERRESAEKVVEERTKAADRLDEVRTEAEIAIAKARENAAAEIAELRAKAAEANELAESRARIADQIAEENESLRVQLNSQAGNSDSLREQVARQAIQVDSLTKLVMDHFGQSNGSKSMSGKPLKLPVVAEKALRAGDRLKKLEGSRISEEETTPPEKRRRMEAALSVASGGA